MEEGSLITSKEWRWVWIFAAAVMIVTTVPYLIAYASQGSGHIFSGFLFGVEDGNSYIAKMVRGGAGDWLFRTPFTAYPQKGILAFLPYILLGKLASYPAQHEQLIALFHIYRFVAGFSCIAAAYFFISIFIQQISMRRFIMLIFIAGGGLGWLLLLTGQGNLFGSPPLELYSPESFGFLELYGIPHLSNARGLLLISLGLYLLFGDKDQDWPFRAILSGCLLFAVGTLQPATLAEALYLIGLHLAVTGISSWRNRHSDPVWYSTWKRRLRFGVLSAVVSLPYLLYSLYQFNTDPVLKTWLSQNILTSPHPLHYLFAYGLVLPFAILGSRKLLSGEKQINTWFLIIWVISLPLLAYAPVTVQRRLPESIWIAWVILAGGLFDGVKVRAWQRWKPLLLTSLPTTILVLIMGVFASKDTSNTAFIPAEEVRTYETIGEIARPDDVLLSAYATGNRAPAWSHLRVVIGHGPESAGLAELLPRVTAFYSGTSTPAEENALLDELSIDYVFWGPAEKKLGQWAPDPLRYHEVVEGEYSVYKVIHLEEP